MVARLAVRQQGAVALEKAVQVVGDRSKPDAAPTPFTEMPIVYERACGGVDAPANPIGVSRDDGQEPNILDPGNPRRPAGFGPIPEAWPLRRQRLGDTPKRAIDANVIELPQTFDWSYFQSAPDQTVAELWPDAILVLEGFHAERPRIEVALPGVRAVGAIYGLDDAQPDTPAPLTFRADTIHVDADRWLCTVSWRAYVDLRDEAQLGRVLVAAGVGVGGREPAIPRSRPQATAAVQRPSQPPLHGASTTGTMAIPDDGAPPAAGSNSWVEERRRWLQTGAKASESPLMALLAKSAPARPGADQTLAGATKPVPGQTLPFVAPPPGVVPAIARAGTPSPRAADAGATLAIPDDGDDKPVLPFLTTPAAPPAPPREEPRPAAPIASPPPAPEKEVKVIAADRPIGSPWAPAPPAPPPAPPAPPPPKPPPKVNVKGKLYGSDKKR
jgi:hypothetical protein